MKFLLHFLRLPFIVAALLLGQTAYAQCDTPGVIRLTAVTLFSAELEWQNITGKTGYKLVLKPTSAGQPTPKEWNIAVLRIQNNMSAGGLKAEEKYCAYIRTVCTNNDTSDINSLCFTTGCDSIEPTVTGYIDTTDPTRLIFKWQSLATILGGHYEHALSTQETPPVSGGTRTTADTVLMQGLVPGTRYCFFVRYYCSKSQTRTKWAKTCVTTPYPAGIAGTTTNNHISISPNPAHDIINIALPALQSAHSITISDITGRKVYQGNTLLQTTAVNTASFVAGMYFIHISGKEYNTTQKVLIQ